MLREGVWNIGRFLGGMARARVWLKVNYSSVHYGKRLREKSDSSKRIFIDNESFFPFLFYIFKRGDFPPNEKGKQLQGI